MIDHDTTLTPQKIIEDYCRSFVKVHGRDPVVLHLGGPWYEVNGETVHRFALLTETERLKTLIPPRPTPVDRGIINRLIAKLRGI